MLVGFCLNIMSLPTISSSDLLSPFPLIHIAFNSSLGSSCSSHISSSACTSPIACSSPTTSCFACTSLPVSSYSAPELCSSHASCTLFTGLSIGYAYIESGIVTPVACLRVREMVGSTHVGGVLENRMTAGQGSREKA